MATAGDLFGFLVSDLVPKSTEVSRFQEESELRFGIQQQLTALVCVERTQLKYCIYQPLMAEPQQMKLFSP